MQFEWAAYALLVGNPIEKIMFNNQSDRYNF